MKQGRDGNGGSNALRGFKNLRALHSRVRQARCKSLPVASVLEGGKTSREQASLPRQPSGGPRKGGGAIRVKPARGAKGQARRHGGS
jgi:hypothetical protein